MNKCGSHVGMILSFVVFITFLVFILAILQPMFNEGRDKKAVLDYISNNIGELISSELVITAIEVNQSKYDDAGCFKINGEAEIKKYGTVKDKNNVPQKTLSWPLQYEISVEPESVSEEIFKVYSSDETIFPEKILLRTDCISLGEGKISDGAGYEIKSVRTEKHPFLTKALSIGVNVSLTNETHKELGKLLKVPPGTEFSVQIINESGSEILGQRLNLNTEIYTQEISIEYVNFFGNVKQGKIRVNVA